MRRGLYRTILALLFAASAFPAAALDRPWISDTFFYWYTWDYDRELGGWIGGVHNTPLDGYYDSRTLRDNRRSLWTASEWGLTHHFMDYWAPGWMGDGNQTRETVVMRAAESLRRDGYDIWMSYYQDGENFEMKDFSRNVSEKRDVYQWLRDFARSPVWPKIDGEPLQLVYGRNGTPKTTLDHAGFRAFLKERFGDIASLNRAWGASYRDFGQIEMSLAGRGPGRAFSVAYQYRIWQREWSKLNGLVQNQFGLPGMRASFDVGYEPYLGLGFADYARVLGGPHSYGGIFGPPHDQDVQRYIQASVARKYNTVFFDHFKNYYFDWDIRIPGTAFLPDPFHFDRFWVGALARRSEALLHLSWNEWWEGSNLEPSREFGKTYCEKNLLYATLMKLAFDSIHNAEREASVAVLLNDWRLASGAPLEEELYDTIQILRRLCVPFDLVPDGLATAESLKRFQLVIAPAYASGLGYNDRGERIGDVLAQWLRDGSRRLVVSHHPSLATAFGLRETAAPAGAADVKGPDLNVFVDVGAEGDEQFLRSGYTLRETQGPAANPADPRSTFRWTPGVGKETSLLVPASSNRDHVLRLVGSSIWPNRISVLINGREASNAAMPAGDVRLEFAIPAAAIGALPVATLDIRFAHANVPVEKAPAQYPGENRVCNLMLESLQWSTANIPADTRKQQFTLADDKIFFADGLLRPSGHQPISVAVQPRAFFDTASAQVLSRLERGDAPRDMLLRVGPSEVLYVNGPLSEIRAEGYWLSLASRWAKVEFPRYAAGSHCMVNRLRARDTQFVVAFNEDIGQARGLRLSIPDRDLPLSEAVILARDGDTYRTLPTTAEFGCVTARDAMRYYGAYQFAFSPMKVVTPPLALQPGERKKFNVTVRNLTSRPILGQIEPGSVIPTISGPPVAVELPPNADKAIELEIAAAPTADWGRKTIYLTLVCGNRRAVVFRELVVQKPADVELRRSIVDAKTPILEVAVPKSPYGETAALHVARASFAGKPVELAVVGQDRSALVSLPRLDLPAPRVPELLAEKLRLELAEPRKGQVLEREVFLARMPEQFAGQPQAVAAAVVFNARSGALQNEPIVAKLPAASGPLLVRTGAGAEVPSQRDAPDTLRWLADVPARGARTFYLCRGETKATADLRCVAEGLGTGKGTLRVENAKMAVTLSEAAGGTVTSFRSAKTGRDYARKSFGVNYGRFSKHDPATPATNTVEYIDENKVRQEDKPGRIELIAHGRAAVLAKVAWSDGKVAAEQVYEFRAGQPYFVVRAGIHALDLAGQEELVAFNAQLEPHRLTKTYPSFTGAPSDARQPHFGWRYGSWVPDYASLLAPDHFDESVSLVIKDQTGLKGIRQGFWPRERPKAGKREIAQIELLADPARGCTAEVYVLLHEGHQVIAKRLSADLALPAAVYVSELAK